MTLIKSIFTYQCPRCRSSKIFKTPFQFTNPLAMPEKCPNCELNFEQEPGFYFGALFISYGVSIVLFLSIALSLVFGFDWSVGRSMAVVLIVAALFFFKIMRVSRSIWIHIIIKYEKRFLANN
ncbi:MAG: DUF983 domain-containing protein [Bacteroidota bacterium]